MEALKAALTAAIEAGAVRPDAAICTTRSWGRRHEGYPWSRPGALPLEVAETEAGWYVQAVHQQVTVAVTYYDPEEGDTLWGTEVKDAPLFPGTFYPRAEVEAEREAARRHNDLLRACFDAIEALPWGHPWKVRLWGGGATWAEALAAPVG